MAVSDYNTNPDLNTQISGINIAEGCPPSGINNAIRQLMADVKGKSTEQDAAIAACVTSADLGDADITATGSTTPRYLADRFADIVNVKDFGAVGDGVTDDTAAIQAALDGGGRVYIPAGTYVLTDTLRVPSNTSFLGSGIDITILRMREDVPYAKTTITNKKALTENRYTPNQYTTEERIIQGTGEPVTYILHNITVPGIAHEDAYDKNIEIGNFTLENNGDARVAVGASGHGSGVAFFGVHDVFVHNVRSVNPYQHGFDVNAMEETSYMLGHFYKAVGQSYNVVFENNIAENPVVDDGITTHDSHHIVIKNHISINDPTRPLFSYNQHGIEVDDGSSFVTVQNCYCEGFNVGVQVQSHKFSPATHDVTISNCTSNKCSVGVECLCRYDDIPAINRRKDVKTRNVKIYACSVKNAVLYHSEAFAREYGCIIAGYMNVEIDGLDIDCNANLPPVTLAHGAADCKIRNVNFHNVPHETSSAPLNGMIYVYNTAGDNNSIENISTDHALYNIICINNTPQNMLINNVSCITAATGVYGVLFATTSFNAGKYFDIRNIDVPAGTIPIQRGNAVSYATENLLLNGCLALSDGNARKYYPQPLLSLYPVSSSTICCGVPDDKFITLGSLSGEPFIYVHAQGISPGKDNQRKLGAATYRWSEIFAVTTSINTSDAREKQQITTYTDDVLDAWSEVEFRQFIFNDAFEKKGDAARLHSGVIAQQVMEAFAKHGLDATRYALLCYDEWSDEYEDEEVIDVEATYDDDGNELTPQQSHVEHKLVTPAGNRYGIRYSEALCLEAAYQRRRAERLEARVAALEASLARLEERLNG